MKAAVVILNWNGEKFLDKFLPVLIENTNLLEYDLFVADNGSSDNSIELIKNKFPQVKTILLNQNYGFAEGYNRALSQIESNYYILLNSDVEVSNNWLDILYEYMELNTDIAACQPKIKSYYDRDSFEHAGAAGGFIDKYGFPFCRGRIFNSIEQDRGQYDFKTDVFWATGACLMIRSEVFWKVGGFDNEFFAHMEEIDLCWRLNSRGYRVTCKPQSVVYHVGGGTLNSSSPQKTYLNFRNNLLLLYKNLPQSLLKRTLFYRFFFDYLAVLQMLFTLKFADARSVIRARRDFHKIKLSFLEKRNINITHATHVFCDVMYQRAIVFDYYIKRKKTYKQLLKHKSK